MSSQIKMQNEKSKNDGSKIINIDGILNVPERPIIPYIEGDGIGPDVIKATKRVLDGAIEKAYGQEKKIVWLEVLAGEKAQKKYGEYLPEETLKNSCIKGTFNNSNSWRIQEP
jgi:isocitrate dehydrogenase